MNIDEEGGYSVLLLVFGTHFAMQGLRVLQSAHL